MGTNYYLYNRNKVCECCNRTDEEDILHIGKSSYGWSFSFRGYTEKYNSPIIKDVKEWISQISNPDSFIMDEYNNEISKDEFWGLVHSKENDRNHALLYKEGNWTDEAGNSFSGHEFS